MLTRAPSNRNPWLRWIQSFRLLINKQVTSNQLPKHFCKNWQNKTLYLSNKKPSGKERGAIMKWMYEYTAITKEIKLIALNELVNGSVHQTKTLKLKGFKGANLQNAFSLNKIAEWFGSFFLAFRKTTLLCHPSSYYSSLFSVWCKKKKYKTNDNFQLNFF